MEGIFIYRDNCEWSRPKSKKEVKETAENHPEMVAIEWTSLYGNPPETELDILSREGAREIHFVGPDPYTSRKFYGTITISANGGVKVK